LCSDSLASAIVGKALWNGVLASSAPRACDIAGLVGACDGGDEGERRQLGLTSDECERSVRGSLASDGRPDPQELTRPLGLSVRSLIARTRRRSRSDPSAEPDATLETFTTFARGWFAPAPQRVDAARVGELLLVSPCADVHSSSATERGAHRTPTTSRRHERSSSCIAP